MLNSKKINLLPLLLTLPAMIIGVFAMINNQVSPSIYGQNIVISIVGGIVSFLVLLRGPKTIKTKTNIIVITCIFILLLLTFFDEGLHGVHRWLAIGPIRLNIAIAFVPLLIIQLSNLMKSNAIRINFSFILCFALLLYFQPDASQLTAFTFAIAFLLLGVKKYKKTQLLVLIIFIILIVFSWSHLDKLAPVPYVEDILSLVKDMGVGWLVIAIISLLILLMPFFFVPPNNAKLLSYSLGTYLAICILSSFFGNFPVPIIGYGTSPFISYFIAMTWYVNKLKMNH
ncbi:FtsW/RodA/SpoVE family cell cycle protein [Bacillus sp. AFS041924]|uniref:FtsW/RodA/SpoVE family cell cycle protein n=1 Tax=Bacillus sp. AFS041924 TaxID=2033503 RepID=UPI000BFD048D|nr:FtsW/RodA/SpoVE family cell cycle protein [Bacillus sp. AFS041924]PGS56546.1 cell division protein [Bacillus sp. AFS041924]